MPKRVFAEFASSNTVLQAIARMKELGATVADVYMPYPVHDVEHALGIRRSRIPFLAFGAGIVGASAAYFLQWWMNAYDYPLNVGGRPAHMPPAFVPVTFEMGILFCALSAFIAVLVIARMPTLWRPEFEIPGFESASCDKFWVAVTLDAPELEERASEALRSCGALQIVEQV